MSAKAARSAYCPSIPASDLNAMPVAKTERNCGAVALIRAILVNNYGLNLASLFNADPAR
jgi:hypothetical protein